MSDEWTKGEEKRGQDNMPWIRTAPLELFSLYPSRYSKPTHEKTCLLFRH